MIKKIILCVLTVLLANGVGIAQSQKLEKRFQQYRIPVSEIHEQMQTGKYQPTFITDTADTWIGMKARQYRILISLRRSSDAKEEHTDD